MIRIPNHKCTVQCLNTRFCLLILLVFLPGASTFIPQDDRLHGFFTVDSYMHHYARLSGLTNIISKEHLETKIDNLLMEMGLVDHRNTIVGDVFMKGLSGGQKRRLSIALEALAEPCNFLLDEPTSGLDAESALQVMEFLRGYVHAAAGRRVILTIHQPNSFIWKLVDNVVLISKGKLVYQGRRSKQMEAFFATNGHPTPNAWNPADHYVTMVNGEFRDHTLSVDEWAKRFKHWEQTLKVGDQQQKTTSTNKTYSFSNTPTSQPQMSTKQPSTASSQCSSSQERSSTPIPTNKIETIRVRGFVAIRELTYRYFLNLWFNPGILATRVAMYALLGKYNCTVYCVEDALEDALEDTVHSFFGNCFSQTKNNNIPVQ